MNIKRKLSLYQIYEQFTCYKRDEHCIGTVTDSTPPPLPFSCNFAKHSSDKHIVAVASEDGRIHLIDTLKHSNSLIKTWQAHVNAVFDVTWLPDFNKLLTASGDQTAQLWDVEYGKCVSVFKGHTCSLRSLSLKTTDYNIFATGARDGCIMVWDMRSKVVKSGQHKPVNVLRDVHKLTVKGRSSSARAEQQQQYSVTSVIYKDDNELFSSGSIDGTVKLWDMRRYYSNARGVPQPKFAYPHVERGDKRGGVSCLTLSRSGMDLFVSSTDNVIYQYNTYLNSRSPVAVYSGHTSNTFYVKTCLSLDNRFLLSGSSSHKVMIWDTADPNLAPVALVGHTAEVTSVTCSHVDIGIIVSCSDDGTIRIWRLHDQMSLTESHQKIGSAERLQRYKPLPLPESPPDPIKPRASPRTSRATRVTRATRVHATSPLATLATRTINVIVDSEVPGPSQDTLHTPKRPKVKAEQGTPGKISSYFKVNDLASAEKNNKERTTPIRSSPRLKSKLTKSPRKTNIKPKPLSFDETTPEKPIPPKRILTRSPKISDKHETLSQMSSKLKQKLSNDNEAGLGACLREEAKSRVTGNAVTIATQTTPPICGGNCTRCCYKISPVFTPTLSHTPVDSTPTSCSSIHRRQNRQIKDNIDTTPTKGNTQILRRSTSAAASTTSPFETIKVRRKFTRTGTPIHGLNCRCNFCLSSYTEISQLSSSPIQEMPSRPKKRSIHHTDEASLSKKRKSLFESEPLTASSNIDTIGSCTPESQEKENHICNFKTPEKRHSACGDGTAGVTGVTVSDWFDKLSCDVSGGEDTEVAKGQSVEPLGHDHSQCASLHCIRSFFKCDR